MIRRPRFLSPQERVKSPPHFNFNLPQKQVTHTYSQIGPYIYDSQHPIGKGQFSVVYRGYEINKPNNVVAVKVITIQQNNAIQKIMIDNEINILSKINHENILKLYYYRYTPTTVYIVTQFCRKGDLLQIISKSILPEDIAFKYILQLARALQYLHSMQYVHGDVKSANILISDYCVLADFGFSQEFNKNQTAFLIGTPVYMAPEVLFRNEVSAAADMWSLGSVLFEMVYGYPPFYAEQESQLRQALQSYVDSQVLRFPNTGVSRRTQALISELMKCDPDKRMTALTLTKLLDAKILNSSLNSGADTPKKQIEDQETNETKRRQPNMRFYQENNHNLSLNKQQSLRKFSNGRNQNNEIVSNKSKQIELIDLIRFFYKVYLEFKDYQELEISIKFLFLKLVNIYYIIYLEEQAKIQKKVVFIPCQNEFFQLEKEIKYNFGFYLKDEEFNKIFYSKFQLTSDFIKYVLDQLQIQQLLHKDNEYGDRIRKSLQIINMLINKSDNPQISQQVQLIHCILY